jgi:hypothetical protein
MSDAVPPDVDRKAEWFGRDILGELVKRFPVDPATGEVLELTDTEVDAWWARFGGKAESVLLGARDEYMRPTNTGRRFPTLVQFERYVEHAATAVQREANTGRGCIGPGCDGGFVRTEAVTRGTKVYDNQVQPCPHCKPDQAQKHRREWAPSARRSAPVAPDTLLDFNPKAAIAASRALAEAMLWEAGQAEAEGRRARLDDHEHDQVLADWRAATMAAAS